MEIEKLDGDIKAKNDQIAKLGKEILDFVMASHDALDKSDIVQVNYPFQTSHNGLVLLVLEFINDVGFSHKSQVISLLSSGCF